MGGRSQDVLHHQPRLERVSQRPQAGKHAQNPRQNHDVLYGGLTGIVDYKALIPFAIASQSSCSLGRKTEMAKMAITTKTPTRMAYSVVP